MEKIPLSSRPALGAASPISAELIYWQLCPSCLETVEFLEGKLSPSATLGYRKGKQVILLGVATFSRAPIHDSSGPQTDGFTMASCNITGFWALSAVSDWASLNWDLIIYISNNFPRNADTTSLGPTLWESLL